MMQDFARVECVVLNVGKLEIVLGVFEADAFDEGVEELVVVRDESGFHIFADDAAEQSAEVFVAWEAEEAT